MKIQSVSNSINYSGNRNFGNANATARRAIKVAEKALPVVKKPLPQPVKRLLSRLSGKSAPENLKSLAQEAEEVCKKYEARALLVDDGKVDPLSDTIVRLLSAQARINSLAQKGKLVIDISKIDINKPILPQIHFQCAKLANFGDTTVFKDGTKATEIWGMVGLSNCPIRFKMSDGSIGEVFHATCIPRKGETLDETYTKALKTAVLLLKAEDTGLLQKASHTLF